MRRLVRVLLGYCLLGAVYGVLLSALGVVYVLYQTKRLYCWAAGLPVPSVPAKGVPA